MIPSSVHLSSAFAAPSLFPPFRHFRPQSSSSSFIARAPASYGFFPSSTRRRRAFVVTSTASSTTTDTKQDESSKPEPSPGRQSGADFRWENRWYPVAWESDVLPGNLRPFFLFGHRFVLFRDTCTGIYAVMDDICPHRKAPLSDGRLYTRATVTGEERTVLECAYHGWKFSCEGTCIDIPHAEKDRKLSPGTNVSSVYATTVTEFGLIFMWYGDRLLADESKLPIPQRVLDGPDNMVFLRPLVRRFPFATEYILENLLDPGHVAFAHHGTSEGRREQSSRKFDMRAKIEDGSEGYLKSSLGLKGLPITALEVSLLQGIGIHYRIAGASGKSARTDLMLYVIPSERNVTTVFLMRFKYNTKWVYRTFRPLVPLWIDHCQNNLTFDGDSPLIQHQSATMAGRKWNESSERDRKFRFIISESSMDALVAVFHTWFEKARLNMPFDPTDDQDNDPSAAASYLTREQVNDRYKWHVKDCPACSGALRNLRALMWAAAGVMVTAIATGVAIAVVAACAGMRTSGVVKSIAWCVAVALLAAVVAVAAGKGIKALTYTDKALRLQQTDSPAQDMNSEEFRLTSAPASA